MFTRARVVQFRADQAPLNVIDEPQGYLELALSSDGKHLALTVDPRGRPADLIAAQGRSGSYRADLYTREIAARDFTRRATGEIRRPVFVPGGRRVLVSAGAPGERVLSLVENDRTIVPIVRGTDVLPLQPYSVTADGTRLAYDHNGNLYIARVEANATPEEFLQSSVYQGNPSFSPDDKWIAIDVNDGRGGPFDVWVRPYPQREPAVRVSFDAEPHRYSIVCRRARRANLLRHRR